MSDVTINYKGSSIVTMDTSGTKTLETEGCYCEDDIEVVYAKPSSGSTLISGVLRPDAVKVKTYSGNSLLVTDDKITLPAWQSSSLTIIKAGAAFSETYTVDLTNYNYFVLERFATIPIYSTTTKGKGREDYHIGSCLYELVNVPENTFEAQSGTKFANANNTLTAAGAVHRILYWSGASAVNVYNASSYGLVQTPIAASLSGSDIIIWSPDVKMRGSNTYLNSTYYGYITDVRVQFVIDIYRAPKVSGGVNGWGLTSQLNDIINRLVGNNWTL